MSRRRRVEKDTRPKWNDDLKITFRRVEYTADEWQKMCARAIATDMTPHYKNDPTYNLRKKNVKK